MPSPILAFDIGGAVSVAALVRDGRVLDRRRVLTRRGAGAGAWLDSAADIATLWRGRFRRAVTVVHDLPGSAELAPGLSHRMGFPVTSLPEAQAAAWSEHRFGAARGDEMVFISAGMTVAGAVITGGALLRGAHGLAGQIGRLPVGGGRMSVSDIAGGTALLRRAASHGARDLSGLIGAASAGARWAVVVLDDAAEALAGAIVAVQAVLDPPVIVLGGALGAAPGFADRLQGRLAEVSPRPRFQPATQTSESALIGAADHAQGMASILSLSAT